MEKKLGSGEIVGGEKEKIQRGKVTTTKLIKPFSTTKRKKNQPI